MFSKKSLRLMICIFGLAFLLVTGMGFAGSVALADEECNGTCPDDSDFTADFRLQDCKRSKTIGANPYFKLIPGYRLVLEGDGERAEVSVLWETEVIDLRNVGLGLVRTRVVEEREWEDDVLIEISRNFFAICKKTNSVFYFGEDSAECDLDDTGGFAEDECFCEDGSDPDDEGSWRAGEPAEEGEGFNMPGLIMPGTFLLGSRYFQEHAPGVAMDRGENLEMGLDWPEDEPIFEGICVKVLDTNPLDCECGQELPNGEINGDVKIYCAGIGLVQDEDLELVGYGFPHSPWWHEIGD